MGIITKTDLNESLNKRYPKQATESAKDSFEQAILDQKEEKAFDIFFSHSYLDKPYIVELKLQMEEMGFSVYIDWIADLQLNRMAVNKKTAETLRSRMKACDVLFFATSLNSPISKWMPWELGYFDGLGKKIAVIPIADNPLSNNEYKGQEYLDLYPFVTKEITCDIHKGYHFMIHSFDHKSCHCATNWFDSKICSPYYEHPK